METKKKTEVKVGITVLVGVLIFVWVLSWSKNIVFFSDDKFLQIAFDMVPGLEVGDVVTVNGVRGGKVKTIELKDSDVLVDISLEGDLILYSDATFHMMMLDLMGGKKIEIFPGNSGQELDFNRIHRGVFTGDIATTMAMLNSVQSDLVSVIRDIKVSLEGMNALLDKGNLRDEILASLRSARKATDNLSNIMEENQIQIRELISSGSELVKNTNDFVVENRQNMSDLIVEVQSAVKNSELMLHNINSIIEETKDQKNNLGKILYDEELLDKMKSTISQLLELTEIVRKQIEGKGFKVDANIF